MEPTVVLGTAAKLEVFAQDFGESRLALRWLLRKGPHAKREFRARVPEIDDLVDRTHALRVQAAHQEHAQPEMQQLAEGLRQAAYEPHRVMQRAHPEKVSHPEPEGARPAVSGGVAPHLGDDARRLIVG